MRKLHPRPVRPARGRDRAVDRVQAGRLHRAGHRPRPARGVPAGRGVQPLLRRRRPRDLGRARWPSCSRWPGPTTSSPASTWPRTAGPTRSTSRWRWPRAPASAASRSSRAWRSPASCTRRGAVTGVRTEHGDIEAEFVVNCAGMWARQLGAAAGVNIPLQAAEHYYLITEQIEGLVATVAGDRGPGSLRLLPRGGRRADDRPVRAGVRAVEGRRHPGRLLVRLHPARLGSDGAVRRGGDAAACPITLRDGHPDVLLRAGELHARPAAGGRRGARAAELLRRRRAELDRHPHRRRHRAGAGPLDPRPADPTSTSPASTSTACTATRRTPSTGATRTVESLGMVYQCHYPNRSMHDRPRRQGLAAPRPAGRRRRLLQGRQRLGGRRLVRAGRRRARRRGR